MIEWQFWNEKCNNLNSLLSILDKGQETIIRKELSELADYFFNLGVDSSIEILDTVRYQLETIRKNK